MKAEEKPDHEIPRELPFNVPEGYFEAFPERLMQRIDSESHQKRGKVFQLNYRYYAAASILVVLAAVFTYQFMINHGSSLSEQAMVQPTIDTADETILFSEIGDEVMEEEITGELIAKEGRGEEVVFEYLVDHGVELEDIMVEYQ